jgi:hypothetical protein
MLLTKDELHSLVELMHQSPHSLLGMHPLGLPHDNIQFILNRHSRKFKLTY